MEIEDFDTSADKASNFVKDYLFEWQDFVMSISGEQIDKIDHDISNAMTKGDYMSLKRAIIKLTAFKVSINKLIAGLEDFEQFRKEIKNRKK